MFSGGAGAARRMQMQGPVFRVLVEHFQNHPPAPLLPTQQLPVREKERGCPRTSQEPRAPTAGAGSNRTSRTESHSSSVRQDGNSHGSH